MTLSHRDLKKSERYNSNPNTETILSVIQLYKI